MFRDAIALHKSGQLDEATSLCRGILDRDPRNVDALNLLGVIELQKRNLTGAIELIDRALRIAPNNAVLHNNRGLALQKLRRLDDALASYDRAVAINPDYAEAHSSRGDVLFELNRFEDAVAGYDRALAINPRYAIAFNNRGLALQKLRRLDEAVASYDRALAVRPNYPQALNNRGFATLELRRFDEALASCDRALALNPDYVEALNNRGNALQELRRLDEALESYDRSLTIKPDYAFAWNNRGRALMKLKRLEDALASFDRALAINPVYAEALASRGDVLYDLKRFDDAVASYGRALAIKPDQAFLFGRWLFGKQRICDWTGLAEAFSRLAAEVDSGQQASPLFAALASPLSAAQLKGCSELYIRKIHPRSPLFPNFAGRREHERIRLGYFSADFRNHPVAHLIAGLVERHDRGRFEVIGVSFGRRRGDAMRARLEKSFDRFIDVDALSDTDAASLAHKLEIDIAIDLCGFTTESRTGMFAAGLAPIQVNYLGYPGTMGADYFDYIIADSTVIPNGQQEHYVEKVVYLPDTYQANDATRVIAAAQPARAEFLLPEKGFVFCCFNNTYKFTPAFFDIWMRLLKRIAGSVLWLPASDSAAVSNLRREAEARGVEGARLIFASLLPNIEDHLARLKLADLFLDTLPFNAHSTASDALFAGLPVLTCLGQTFQGRVAASLLKAVGLPELITRSLDEYEALALRLATNPQELVSLREKLAANRLTHPLFDTALFTKHIESAYLSMWERHRERLAPEHIYVQP